MTEKRKWLAVFGEYRNQQKRALDIVIGKMSEFCTYIIPARHAEALTEAEREEHCLVLIGTYENNKYIRELCDFGEVKRPDKREGYTVKVTERDPDGKQTAVIVGYDASGVMYGAAEFAYHYMGTLSLMNGYCLSDAGFFESGVDELLPPFEITTAPAVRERGLWSWGHVIYDYRGYLETMADLRMNQVIIWNDGVPINAHEVVEYAHSLGIKIIWGYSWGWNTRKTDKIDISEKALAVWADQVIRIYEDQYIDTGADGIYFQSFTELETDNKDGILIADAVTRFVNGIVDIFLSKHPNLRIMFGVHATSVKNHTEFMAKVDPRVEMIWEDLGGFPYWYIIETDNFKETNAFSEKIANLRGNEDKFGVVIKEMTKLDWSTFRHIEGSYVMGGDSELTIKKLLPERERRWREMQSYWIENADLLLENIRTLRDAKNGDLTVTALVEDGLFERGAWLPTALLAAALWNPDRSDIQLIKDVTKWSNVRFANTL